MPAPTMGWRTFKGIGSRLLRRRDDESRSIQVREGLSGWKEGLTFVRLFRYITDDAGKQRPLYTILALDERDSIIGMATGEFDGPTWSAIFASLRKKGHEVNE